MRGVLATEMEGAGGTLLSFLNFQSAVCNIKGE